EILPSGWWSVDFVLGMMDGISEKTENINERAKQLNRVHKLVTQEEPKTLDVAMHYLESTVYHVGGYTDAEDVSVLTDGKTTMGKPATSYDYAFASVGIFIPFISGGAIKQTLK